MARAALKRLDAVAEERELEESVIEQLRAGYELRLHRLAARRDGAGDPAAALRETRRLRRELIQAERSRLHELRARGKVSLSSQRRLERDLDLEESRLGG
jgi:CPA1 family monovalent cation:H+ antiporter